MSKPLFSLVLLLILISNSISTISATPPKKNPGSSRQITPQNTLINSIASIWERKPRRKRLVSRSGVCAISPGLVDTYFIWSDRPLFLWNSPGKNAKVQLIVREEATDTEVWSQTVNLTDQKVFYNGEKPLEPGKRYQWQLLGENKLDIIKPSIFQIIAASEREKIQTDLQALEQKLKVNKTSPEEIAIQKADYFFNYQITHQTEKDTFGLWSDALEILYKVEQPSPSFLQQRQAKVEGLCNKN
jgi:Domain of Unknown Function (DUF928)